MLVGKASMTIREDVCLHAHCSLQVISGDPTWSGSMEYALNLVSRRGGPQAMLRSSTSTFTRRYLLEQIATHDVFSGCLRKVSALCTDCHVERGSGSFINGKEPTLLGNFDPWWFESVQTSVTRWEWESVERTWVTKCSRDKSLELC